MGNALTNLRQIAADNCAQTFSFSIGRSFGENTALFDIGGESSGRQLPQKITNAFNNDLTDCVEVITPFSAFGHLGNGQGLFRSGRAMPYHGDGMSFEETTIILEGKLY